MTRSDLVPIVRAALVHAGGKADIAQVAKYIFDNHEADLRRSGKMLYTWQYDMRWAADALVRSGEVDKTSKRGIWRLL